MSSKWAVVFNTDELGGAERSLLEQFKHEKNDFVFFIPKITINSNIISFIEKNYSKTQVEYYSFPKVLYKISRSKMGILNILKTTIGLFDIILNFLKFNAQFNGYSNYYFNGNKAAIWSILCLQLNPFKKVHKIKWHFRDYPSSLVFIFFKFISAQNKKRMVLIANSKDVADKLGQLKSEVHSIEVLYNLCGSFEKRKIVHSSLKKIGVVGMFSPWKGQHQILLMMKLYEQELEKIGIEEVIFFGKEIYHTDGNHGGYLSELKMLCEKLKIKKIRFEHHHSPSEIYSQIDLLIHSSIEPEPFGRVIMEAFKSGIPVISTGLGGASELIEGDKNGCTFFPFQYSQLFRFINLLKSDDQQLSRVIQGSSARAISIENNITLQLETLLDDSEKRFTIMEL